MIMSTDAKRPVQQRTLKYFTDNYVCRVCRHNLKLSRDEYTGHWSIVCAADAGHHGAWSKRYLEERERQERAEFLEIIYDRKLRELWPWLPATSDMSAAEAMDDLFGL